LLPPCRFDRLNDPSWFLSCRSAVPEPFEGTWGIPYRSTGHFDKLSDLTRAFDFPQPPGFFAVAELHSKSQSHPIFLYLMLSNPKTFL
jgi:hypothetical protein